MDQKLFKIAQNGPKRPKIAQNGPKLFPSLSRLQFSTFVKSNFIILPQDLTLLNLFNETARSISKFGIFNWTITLKQINLLCLLYLSVEQIDIRKPNQLSWAINCVYRHRAACWRLTSQKGETFFYPQLDRACKMSISVIIDFTLVNSPLMYCKRFIACAIAIAIAIALS